MKILVIFLCLVLAFPASIFADDVPLDEVILLDVDTFDPATGAPSNADSTPSCKVYEEITDTAIISGSMVLRTSTTGEYRMQVSVTSGNGFEVGKWYTPKCTATVGGLEGRAIPSIDTFRVSAAEVTAGYSPVESFIKNSLAVRTAISFQWAMKFRNPTTGADISGASPTCTRSIDDSNSFSSTTNSASTTTSTGWSELTLSTGDMTASHYVILRCTAGAGTYETVFKVQTP